MKPVNSRGRLILAVVVAVGTVQCAARGGAQDLFIARTVAVITHGFDAELPRQAMHAVGVFEREIRGRIDRLAIELSTWTATLSACANARRA